MSKLIVSLSTPNKGKFTCPKCSDGHKNGNYWTKHYDFGFDDPDYDENKAAKVFKQCNNCGYKVPIKLRGKRK